MRLWFQCLKLKYDELLSKFALISTCAATTWCFPTCTTRQGGIENMHTNTADVESTDQFHVSI